MKKYIIAIIIGLILIIAIDYSLGSCLKFFYFNQSSGLLHRTTHSMEKTEADILIFGASRANHHYNSKFFEEATSLSTYNTGRDGNFIFYQTAVLESILTRYNPKHIILDFAGTFAFEQKDYDRLASLLPYYKSHPEIRDIVLLKSTSEKYKLLSKIYPFNSLLTTIAVGNMEFNKNRSKNIGSYNGFVPLSGEYSDMIDTLYFPNHYEIDLNKYNVFEDFIQLSKQKGIPLIVVYSPVYYLYDKDYSIEICKQICDNNNIAFIDFSKDEDFLNNGRLFQDKLHLNNGGAKLFTQKILAIIRDKENSTYN